MFAWFFQILGREINKQNHQIQLFENFYFLPKLNFFKNISIAISLKILLQISISLKLFSKSKQLLICYSIPIIAAITIA